jgi:diguanylate cyclase (GGDEF)-like protein
MGSWWLAVAVPCLLIVLILGADHWESPKTAYVGVLTGVPFIAANFGTPVMTAVTAVITWASAYIFGLLAEDGNVPAQTVRLGFIAGAGLLAIGAAYLRQRREEQYREAQRAAMRAETLGLQARQDELTGLLNRRGLLERMAAGDIDVATVVVFDCDQFKEINDTYGHLVGDEYLRDLAGRLSGAVSRDDLVARWGGDEFLMIIRGPFEQGTMVAERVIQQVMKRPMQTPAGMIDVSLSAGAAALTPDVTLDQAVGAADRAMYAVKGQGGGRVLVAPPR